VSDVRHSYLPYSCGRHTTWRCHCGEVTSHGRRREGGRQSNRVPTSRYRRTLPPTPQEASPHSAGEADRSNRGLPQRSHTTKGFRVATRSTTSGPFRRTGFVTRRLADWYDVRTRSATWLAASRVPLTGQSNPSFALFPGFPLSGIARSSIAATSRHLRSIRH